MLALGGAGLLLFSIWGLLDTARNGHDIDAYVQYAAFFGLCITMFAFLASEDNHKRNVEEADNQYRELSDQLKEVTRKQEELLSALNSISQENRKRLLFNLFRRKSG